MTSYCFYHGEIVRVSDFVATMGHMPEQSYSVRDLSYNCSSRQYEAFMRNGPSLMNRADRLPIPPSAQMAPGQAYPVPPTPTTLDQRLAQLGAYDSAVLVRQLAPLRMTPVEIEDEATEVEIDTYVDTIRPVRRR